jgi:signal transduction histidine kinase
LLRFPKLAVIQPNEDSIEFAPLSEGLTARGFTVLQASSLESAAESIRITQPDFIVIGLGAHHPPALELCASLKGNSETCHIPVIIASSAFLSAGPAIDAYRVGANACLASPVDLDVLAALIDSLWRARLQDAWKGQTEKTEAIGHFRKEAAQIFNSGTMAMLGYLNLVLDSIPEGTRERRYIEHALEAATRLAELSGQVTASGCKDGLTVGLIDLSSLVRENEGLLRSLVPAGVRLELNLQDGLPLCVADAAQFKELLLQLLTNAGEAIGGEPGGSMEIATTSRVIDESSTQDYLGYDRIAPGSYVCLRIQDSGAGIDHGIQRRMFDPFFSTKNGSRGLGLAMVLEILRNHKGGVQVESAPGRGSSFTVCFPEVRTDELRRAGNLRRSSLRAAG